MERRILKWVFPCCLALAVAVLSSRAGAQQAPKEFSNVSPVSGLKTNTPIAMPTNRPGGRQGLVEKTVSPFAASAASAAAPADAGGDRYPGDLQYHGGPVVQFATDHSVFINPTASCQPNSCWGNPIGFLSDLSYSDFVHVTDQYVGTHASNRYPGGANYFIPNYTPSAGAGKPFTDLDIALAAYSVASQTGGFGFNHIYHMFLVPGQDECFDSTFSTCYSPDNNSTFFFCAYHGSAEDSAGNVVLYTVEPFQNVPGCSSRPNGPNGQLADSTNNILSHEQIELITDPFGDAWWNQLDNGLFGQEIGDECSFLLFTSTNVYFDPSSVRLNHRSYAIQPEYDNIRHACSTRAD